MFNYEKYLNIENAVNGDRFQSERSKQNKQKIIDLFCIADCIYYNEKFNQKKKLKKLYNLFEEYGKSKKYLLSFIKQKEKENNGINTTPNTFYQVQKGDYQGQQPIYGDDYCFVENFDFTRLNNSFLKDIIKENKDLIDEFLKLKSIKNRSGSQNKKYYGVKQRLQNIFKDLL